jgi:hypothetical protein
LSQADERTSLKASWISSEVLPLLTPFAWP